MKNEDVTYTRGFEYQINPQLRKCDFIHICDEMKERLTTPEHRILKVVPEPITEGGIKIIYENPTHYKTIRLCVSDWEWISPTTYDEWTNNTDLVKWKPRNGWPYHDSFSKKKTPIVYEGTFLKAFHHAPLWTLKELQIVKDIFETHGMHIKCMPKQKNLKGW